MDLLMDEEDDLPPVSAPRQQQQFPPSHPAGVYHGGDVPQRYTQQQQQQQARQHYHQPQHAPPRSSPHAIPQRPPQQQPRSHQALNLQQQQQQRTAQQQQQQRTAQQQQQQRTAQQQQQQRTAQQRNAQQQQARYSSRPQQSAKGSGAHQSLAAQISTSGAICVENRMLIHAIKKRHPQDVLKAALGAIKSLHTDLSVSSSFSPVIKKLEQSRTLSSAQIKQLVEDVRQQRKQVALIEAHTARALFKHMETVLPKPMLQDLHQRMKAKQFRNVKTKVEYALRYIQHKQPSAFAGAVKFYEMEKQRLQKSQQKLPHTSSSQGGSEQDQAARRANAQRLEAFRKSYPFVQFLKFFQGRIPNKSLVELDRIVKVLFDQHSLSKAQLMQHIISRLKPLGGTLLREAIAEFRKAEKMESARKAASNAQGTDAQVPPQSHANGHGTSHGAATGNNATPTTTSSQDASKFGTTTSRPLSSIVSPEPDTESFVSKRKLASFVDQTAKKMAVQMDIHPEEAAKVANYLDKVIGVLVTDTVKKMLPLARHRDQGTVRRAELPKSLDNVEPQLEHLKRVSELKAKVKTCKHKLLLLKEAQEEKLDKTKKINNIKNDRVRIRLKNELMKNEKENPGSVARDVDEMIKQLENRFNAEETTAAAAWQEKRRLAAAQVHTSQLTKKRKVSIQATDVLTMFNANTTATKGWGMVLQGKEHAILSRYSK